MVDSMQISGGHLEVQVSRGIQIGESTLLWGYKVFLKMKLKFKSMSKDTEIGLWFPHACLWMSTAP